MKAMTEQQAVQTGLPYEQAIELASRNEDLHYIKSKDRFEVVDDGGSLIMIIPAKYVKIQTGDGFEEQTNVERVKVYDFTELYEAVNN